MKTPDPVVQNCERIRRLIDAYVSNELSAGTNDVVLRHLRDCAVCAQDLDMRLGIRDALRKAVRKQAPPDELVEAIHGRLTRPKPVIFRGIHAVQWTTSVAGLALALLLVAGGQQWFSLRQGRRLVASVLSLGVEDHLICTIQHHAYQDEGSPPSLLREKLGPGYAELLDLVGQELPGFQVLEAHQCRPDGKRVYIHFIASGHGTVLSVILTKRNGVHLPTQKLLVTDVSEGIDLYKAQLDGMSIAGFEAGDYFGFVVSDGPQSEMLELAASIAPTIRSALPSSTALQESIPAAEIEEASLNTLDARSF